MGEIVEFPSNGSTCAGYVAIPAAPGPGVVLIQEWWGLVDHIKDVADRLAREGFVAIAPDLFHGTTTKEPDEAGKLMMELQIDGAARDMAGAVAYLMQHPVVEPKKVGAIGFCMGGALTWVLAARENLQAAVPFYGIPSADPGFDRIQAPVLFHVAENDDWVTPQVATELTQRLRAQGKDVEMHLYPDTTHAFFNDARPEVYAPDAASTAWERTIAFLRRHLASG